jgi:ABC-type nickel/cobalt efflux system permease component RcnA
MTCAILLIAAILLAVFSIVLAKALRILLRIAALILAIGAWFYWQKVGKDQFQTKIKHERAQITQQLKTLSEDDQKFILSAIEQPTSLIESEKQRLQLLQKKLAEKAGIQNASEILKSIDVKDVFLDRTHQ